uniref:Putative secreted protein n=1 Tax=Ixodes ricinus TaxID=34613 RepID=A0A6B0UAN7_IXORI
MLLILFATVLIVAETINGSALCKAKHPKVPQECRCISKSHWKFDPTGHPLPSHLSRRHRNFAPLYPSTGSAVFVSRIRSLHLFLS